MFGTDRGGEREDDGNQRGRANNVVYDDPGLAEEDY
jgi:hypothetical protein